MIDTDREDVVRSLAYLFTREELAYFRKKLAKAPEPNRHNRLWGLLNDAELGDYRD